jgi:hypothetical protein
MHDMLQPMMLEAQQQAGSRISCWSVTLRLYGIVSMLMQITAMTHLKARALVPTTLLDSSFRSMALLLQQMQRCGSLLPPAGSAAAADSSSSSSSISSEGLSHAHLSYVCAQFAAVPLLNDIGMLCQQHQLPAGCADQMDQLLLEPTTQELLL